MSEKYKQDGRIRKDFYESELLRLQEELVDLQADPPPAQIAQELRPEDRAAIEAGPLVQPLPGSAGTHEPRRGHSGVDEGLPAESSGRQNRGASSGLVLRLGVRSRFVRAGL